MCFGTEPLFAMVYRSVELHYSCLGLCIEVLWYMKFVCGGVYKCCGTEKLFAMVYISDVVQKGCLQWFIEVLRYQKVFSCGAYKIVVRNSSLGLCLELLIG